MEFREQMEYYSKLHKLEHLSFMNSAKLLKAYISGHLEGNKSIEELEEENKILNSKADEIRKILGIYLSDEELEKEMEKM